MSHTLKARYPSNIALVKYWGKYGNQLPCNPSLSMTLDKAYTQLQLTLSEKHNHQIEFEYYFEDKLNEKFGDRVLRYLQGQKEFSSLLEDYALRLESHNSFPHSAGIASSASAFSAISAVFLHAANPTLSQNDFNRQASHLARLGSGSACRSFYDSYVLWGHLEEIPESSNEYAVPLHEIHDNFRSMRDSILIIDEQPKLVSSSMGHRLMKNHPYAPARFRQGKEHSKKMIVTLKNGDFDAFISIIEREALTLHAMMMTSVDYYLLIKPGTVFMMEQIFQFRKETGLPICFTLDAGPNLHLLYPENIESEVQDFLEGYLQTHIKSIINDRIGLGGSVN
ncbi:MAG TPA: hypothetical protein VK102_07480 [Sphingobacterium sp.]|nr:hypothetical protein [Sphingobacterium sp.]